MPNGTPYEHNEAAAAAGAQALDEAKARAVEGVEQRDEATREAVADFYERDARHRPTPTQRECDLARMGALDNMAPKEDDGGEPDLENQRRIMTARLPGNSPYETRDMSNGNGNGQAPQRRGPGRPRKHPVDEPPPAA